MSTNIFNFDGTLLVTVADGTLNTTAAPLEIPGKGYTSYGAPVVQDILWTMQNFAGSTAPAPALRGVMWYDTGSSSLKLYTGSTWVGVYKADQSNIPTADATFDLGALSTRFNNVYTVGVNCNSIYAASGTINALSTVNITASGVVSAASFVGDPTVYKTTQTNTPSLDHFYNLGSTSLRYSAVYSYEFDGASLVATYGDVAERYETDMPLEIGDVVIIGGDKEITKSRYDSDPDTYGVISHNPAVKMNSGAGDDSTHPYVALVGRTPCKVNGKVFKGDRLVASSIPGVARAARPTDSSHCFIGRALTNKTDPEVALVEIVVGRN